jgi:hypothetical protein
MVRRALRTLATLAPLLLAGCVLEDGGAEVKLYPEGPVTIRTYLVVFVQTSATGEVTLFADGHELDTVNPNELAAVSLVRAGVGEHRIRARAFDGTRAVWSNVVVATYDPTAPP